MHPAFSCFKLQATGCWICHDRFYCCLEHNRLQLEQKYSTARLCEGLTVRWITSTFLVCHKCDLLLSISHDSQTNWLTCTRQCQLQPSIK